MQGFNIRTSDKGSVVFHGDQPLVLCKGFFAKLVGHSFKLEGVEKATLRELVRIAYETKHLDRDHRIVFDKIHKLGETHCFVIRRGFSYDSIALFERDLGKI
ncbi:hypothetical protein PHYNN_40 [Pantoea phage Phynn]|nr:hypothetical protein PHYNN_40 [Pantoea phage Phynn]